MHPSLRDKCSVTIWSESVAAQWAVGVLLKPLIDASFVKKVLAREAAHCCILIELTQADRTLNESITEPPLPLQG